MDNSFVDTVYVYDTTPTGNRIGFNVARTDQKFIINTTEQYKWLQGYLERYCRRNDCYYNLPLYGSVIIQDKNGYKHETNWIIQIDASNWIPSEAPHEPTVSFEELYQKDVTIIGPQ